MKFGEIDERALCIIMKSLSVLVVLCFVVNLSFSQVSGKLLSLEWIPNGILTS